MKNFLKKYINEIIIIITILTIVFITTKFTNTFGSNTDWINQHTIIPEYFRSYFYKTGNLLPNLALNYGGGQNIFNLSYYGLLSPLILPSYLFPYISMTTYMTIIDILVLIISSILFLHFLKNHNYSNNICLTTTLLYTLSAPLIFHMHRHIMFVNYMPFLIMSFMGVDKYIKKKKPNLLIISIFLTIMTSYYYSVCAIIVTSIYYIYMYLENNKNTNIKTFIKDIIKYIFIIIIAILLSGILIIPTLYTLLIGRGDSENTYTLLSLLTPYLKIYKIFNGTYAIGLSLIGFISIIYLFYTKKKNNIIISSLISIILFIPIFRYLLNGGLYLREKCFIPFIPLICYFISYFLKDLFNEKININHFITYLLIIFGLLYYFNRLQYIYLLLIIFIIILLIYKHIKKEYLINTFLILTSLIICIVEANKEDVVSINEYNRIFNKQTEETINSILKHDTDFYRINNLDNPTITINKIYNNNYYMTNYYSSTYNKNYLNFVRNEFKNSMLDYNYFMISSNNNILFNTFMGTKYLYSSTNPGLGYTKITDNLYKNNLAFPIIYSTNKIINTNTYNKLTYPYNIEPLLESVITNDIDNTTIDSLIDNKIITYHIENKNNVSIENINNEYIIKVPNDYGTITIKLDNPLNKELLFINLYGLKENTCKIDNISITINNVSNILTCKTWIYGNRNNTFHYLINDEYIDTLNIKLKKGTYNISKIETYTMDYNKLLNISNNKNKMIIDSIKDSKITGHINILNDSYLVTSIPYDEGFEIYIDDIKTPLEKVNTAFLGAKITKGYHNIKIIYTSPWLNIGKISSLIGLILFITLNNKKEKN